MDQSKIGRFIAAKRKEKNLTQAALGDALGVSDRAVSKWERGLSLPDPAIMLPLCELLCISVNDLLLGEEPNMEDKDKKTEELLLEMTAEKRAADKRLLRVETVLGIFSIAILLGCDMLAAFAPMPDIFRVLLIIVGFAFAIVGISFGIHIEQKAGYYACRACGHRYVPTYSSVLWSMHAGRTRYMRCPRCGKASWQKKVLDPEEDEK